MDADRVSLKLERETAEAVRETLTVALEHGRPTPDDLARVRGVVDQLDEKLGPWQK